MAFVFSPSLRHAGLALLALGLAGCEERAERVPLPSALDIGGGQSGSEGEGSLTVDLTDIAGPKETPRSFIELGRLGPASTVNPLVHLYRESSQDGPPIIALYYGPRLAPGLLLNVELPYEGVDAVLEFPDPARMYLTDERSGGRLEQVAIAGRVVVTPGAGGVELDFEGLVLRDADGGALETIGDGLIRGEVDRRCATLVSQPDAPLQDGLAVLQEVLDPTWSSPFCAGYR